MPREGWFLVVSGSLAGLSAGLENFGSGLPLGPLARDALGSAALALLAAVLVAVSGRTVRAWWQRALLIMLVGAIVSFAAASLVHARTFQLDVVAYTWMGMAWTTTLSLLVAALLVGLCKLRSASGGQEETHDRTSTEAPSERAR